MSSSETLGTARLIKGLWFSHVSVVEQPPASRRRRHPDLDNLERERFGSSLVLLLVQVVFALERVSFCLDEDAGLAPEACGDVRNLEVTSNLSLTSNDTFLFVKGFTIEVLLGPAEKRRQLEEKGDFRAELFGILKVYWMILFWMLTALV